MEAYFKANSTAEKFCNTPPAFLNLLQELFDGILATGNYTRSINEVIKSYINSKLLLVIALQASGLADKENRDKDKDKKEINKAFKLELALNSIKYSYLSLLLTKCLSPFRSSLILN